MGFLDSELSRGEGLLSNISKKIAVETELKRGRPLLNRERKFDPEQPRDESGRWTDGGGGGLSTGSSSASETSNKVGINWKQPTDENGRPVPIKVKSVEEAVPLVLAGKVVEMPSLRAVNILVLKLAEVVQEMKAAGKEAQNFDLCQVTVPGTNLFCISKLRTEEHPEGVPRIKMPQLSGQPVAGSEADKLPRNPYDPSEIDGGSKFREYLEKTAGIKVTDERIPAANLKATQSELVGPKVAGMMADVKFDPAKDPIFVSRDGYVIDGHHRWAAVIGRDVADNKLGDIAMNTYKVDAPISEILPIANKWSADFGIKQKGAFRKKGFVWLAH